MSDQFDKNLREHLHHEAEEIREFPRPLRGRIREGITPRTKSRMAPQLALAGALVLVAFAVVVVRNPQVILKDVPATIKQILQPSPAPTPQPFTCSDHSGGSAGLNAQLTGIRVASHEADGYDRIVFDFSGGVPSYALSRQESATFIRDASGQSLPLDGSAGIKLVFRDTDAGPGVPVDTAPRLKSVREIAQIGNFERVLSYGVGLSSAQCLRTQELSGPSRLVVDVATSPSASATPAGPPGAGAPTDAAGGHGPRSIHLPGSKRRRQRQRHHAAHRRADRPPAWLRPPGLRVRRAGWRHRTSPRVYAVPSGVRQLRQRSERAGRDHARLVWAARGLPAGQWRGELHQESGH